MKMLLLFLSLAMLYSAAQAPFRMKTAVIYQNDITDYLDPSRARLA